MSRRFCLPLLTLLLVTLAAGPARAQTSERDRETYNPATNTADITGQVRLAGALTPVQGVRVSLERVGGGQLDQMLTDNRGRFRFAQLQRGQYVVNVSADCHQTERRQVELVLVFRAYLDVDLRPDTTSPVCAAAARGAAAPASSVDARVPEEARKEYERASASLAKGKDEEGVSRLRHAVELYPDFFAAHMLLASAHTKAGRLEEAEASLERASKIDEHSAAALVSLGEVRRRLKKTAEAEEALGAALKLEEASWQAHLALGRLYLDTNRARSAAPHIGRALQLKPDFPDAHLFAGNLLLKLNEPARALTEYEEYLRLAPSGDYAAPTRELVGKLRKAVAEKNND
ncbi:MAG: tetratricopeptide repeat protein [Acidobacteria bacterium]|nr:tetratricopeptide repeat protein [Acidobacteriota bacterium]